jgi:hypothetical protein
MPKSSYSWVQYVIVEESRYAVENKKTHPVSNLVLNLVFRIIKGSALEELSVKKLNNCPTAPSVFVNWRAPVGFIARIRTCRFLHVVANKKRIFVKWYLVYF